MKKLKLALSVVAAIAAGTTALANTNAFNTTAYYSLTAGTYTLIGTSFEAANCKLPVDTNCAYTVVITGAGSPVPIASFTAGTKPANYSTPVGNGITRHYTR